MIVKTDEFKSVLQKALKCASCNSYIPISCFCRIEELDDTFKVHATDGNSYLVITGDLEDDAPHHKMDCVVDIKSLYALVAKTKTTIIKLFTLHEELVVVGSGEYKMPLPTDENDDLVKFPEIDLNPSDMKRCTVYADNIRDIIRTNRSALPKNNDLAAIDGYVFCDKTITTDSMVICANTLKMFDETVMLSRNAVEILSLFDDCVDVLYSGRYYIFKEDKIAYCVNSNEEIESFPLDKIKSILSTGFPYSVTIHSRELYDTLDRISLFVSPYDANACRIEFSPNHMKITNQNNTCFEDIPVDTDASFNIKINIEFLMSQLKAMQDKITFKFGNSTCVGLCDETTDRIIALMV